MNYKQRYIAYLRAIKPKPEIKKNKPGSVLNKLKDYKNKEETK